MGWMFLESSTDASLMELDITSRRALRFGSNYTITIVIILYDDETGWRFVE